MADTVQYKWTVMHCGISSSRKFSQLNKLELLELGDNRIRCIENIDKLTQLKKLFLGANQIRMIENLDRLTNLTVLSLPGNAIKKMEGLSKLVTLQELILSQNGIQNIEGLENNIALRLIDLSDNQLKRIENVQHLQELQTAWFRNNKFTDWDLSALEGLPKLRHVSFEMNPCCGSDDYRFEVMKRIPKIKTIDCVPANWIPGDPWQEISRCDEDDAACD